MVGGAARIGTWPVAPGRLLLAHGALVGDIPVWGALEGALAHGVTVGSIFAPGTCAQGAFVPSCGGGLAVVAFDAVD